MRFQYAEKKVSLPENVHGYAEKKVMKLERFFGDDADALVTFSVEKNRNNVEITVHAANTYFRASESTSDMFASVAAAVATIDHIHHNVLPYSALFHSWNALYDISLFSDPSVPESDGVPLSMFLRFSWHYDIRFQIVFSSH